MNRLYFSLIHRSLLRTSLLVAAVFALCLSGHGDAQLKNYYPGMPMSGTRIVETLVAVLGALALMAVVLRA